MSTNDITDYAMQGILTREEIMSKATITAALILSEEPTESVDLDDFIKELCANSPSFAAIFMTESKRLANEHDSLLNEGG